MDSADAKRAKDYLRFIESDAHFALANFAVDKDLDMLGCRLAQMANRVRDARLWVRALEAKEGRRG